MDREGWSGSEEQLIGEIIDASPKEFVSLITKLKDEASLGLAAQHLSKEQGLELFATLTNAVMRLAPIVKALPHDTFRLIVLSAQNDHLQAIKQQGMAEPLKYQIAMWIQSISRAVYGCTHTFEILNAFVDNLEPNKISKEQLLNLWQRISTLSDTFQQLMRETSTVLLLAWNTDCEEIIEQLTEMKEKSHRTSRHGIGFPATAKDHATGLFEKLDNKIFALYEHNKLRNSDPSFKGLITLEAYSLKDYWELGLLPMIETIDELDLDQQYYGSEARREYRDKLTQQARLKLEQSGLVTIEDLKQNWIYSKETLKEFLLQ